MTEGNKKVVIHDRNKLSNFSWTKITTGNSKRYNTKKSFNKKPSYVQLSNAYAILPEFSANPPKNTVTEVTQQDASNVAQNKNAHNSGKIQASNSAILKSDQMSNNSIKFKQKGITRYLARQLKRSKSAQDNALLDNYITWVEDKITALAELDMPAPTCAIIEKAHKGYQQKSTLVVQKGQDLAYKLSI